MGLSAALYSGTSGLKAHGESMTVIGNNIANVSTVGFKGSRLHFEDAMSQATTTAAGTGQIGRGVQVGTVMADFAQGSLETTTEATDLAIGGKGFFVVSPPGEGVQYYTRAGNFRFDEDGRLTDPHGYAVQGWKVQNDTNPIAATSTTTESSSARIEGVPTDIVLDNFQSPPQATSQVDIMTNLDSQSTDKSTSRIDGDNKYNTIYDPHPSFAMFNNWDGTSEEPLGDGMYTYQTTIKTYDENGTAHNLTVYFDPVDDAAIESNAGGNQLWEYMVTVNPSEDGRSIQGTDVRDTKAAGVLMTGTLTFNAAGELQNMSSFTMQADADPNYTPVDSDHDDFDYETNNNYVLDPAGDKVYNEAGEFIDYSTVNSLQAGSVNDDIFITNDGTDGGNNEVDTRYDVSFTSAASGWDADTAPDDGEYVLGEDGYYYPTSSVADGGGTYYAYINGEARSIVYDDADDMTVYTASSTQNDYGSYVCTDNIAPANGTFYRYDDVRYVDGSTVDAGTVPAIANRFSLDDTTGFKNLHNWTPADFSNRGYPICTANFLREADASATNLDDGNENARNIEINFGLKNTTTEWNIASGDDFSALMIGGGGGPTEQPGSWQDGKKAWDLLPRMNGKRSALSSTSYNTGSTTLFQSQDGYTAGFLQGVSVDRDGILTGSYSNGQVLELYALTLADFNDQYSLYREGGNLFSETRSSGPPLTGLANASGKGAIASNSLEQSNVDLATEFVSMITTQKGYQANSKTITTTDEMLNVLIQMKR
jgi:flagellar hook protein FlgE